MTFFKGDARKLREVIGEASKPFDVVINTWTSIGFVPQEEELNIFKQARELSREGAVLFVAETMHSEYLSLKFMPTSYTELDDIVLLESRRYEPATSQLNTTWAFYRKRGENLEFIDRLQYEIHVYSLAELSSLLGKAGWETVAFYGSLSILQPMTPLTTLNLVAKAR